MTESFIASKQELEKRYRFRLYDCFEVHICKNVTEGEQVG